MKESPIVNRTIAFGTIVTLDYLPYAHVLFDSINKLNSAVVLNVLVSDTKRLEAGNNADGSNPGIRFTYYDDLCSDGIGKSIFEKYHKGYHDAFRWSMKPVFMLQLLEEFESAIYVDSDIHFFNDFTFLFDLLETHSVLLSPHFRSSDPAKDYDNYVLQFNNGIFNGGFVAANRNGRAKLAWWAKVCNEICEVNLAKGQFVDQSHLNLMPIYFDDVYILKHRGCNVANWNLFECVRMLNSTGEVVINNSYPVIFIHFTRSTVRGIIAGDDQLLRPFLEVYLKKLSQHGVGLEDILPSEKRISLWQKFNIKYVIRVIRHRATRRSVKSLLKLGSF